MPISFILQFPLLNFLSLPFFRPLLLSQRSGALASLSSLDASPHQPCHSNPISPRSVYIPLTHQSRRAPRQSPISAGAPMSTCTAKPLFSLTEPQSFPSVSFHLVSRPSENSYVYESMWHETKERKQTGQKTHSCHV